MKRLLIGGLAVGSLLFAASGVASANTTTPQALPTAISLAKTVATSSVSGGAWPTAPNPGSVTVSFATPASGQAISGYSVTCKAPTKDTLGNPISLPNLVATFAVNPADGSSADGDYSNDGTTTSLTVGPYSVVAANELPPLTCTVTAINAGGAKAGVAGPATSPAPSGTCSDSNATAASGLENVLGSGDLSPVTGVNNRPPTAPSTGIAGGAQTSQTNTFVIANLTSFGSLPQVPFCTTNPTYNPHLLSDQATTFAQTVSFIPAVTPFVAVPSTLTHTSTGCASLTTGPASTGNCKASLPAAVHASEAKFTGLGLSAKVKSALTLQVSAGSEIVYAYDSYDFHLDSCPGTATVSCITNTAAIIAGSGGALTATPGVGLFAVVDGAPHTVLPGAALVGAKVSPVFSKTGNPNPAPPAAVGVVFGGAQLTLGITVGGSLVSIPLQVAEPGTVIKQLSGGLTDGGDTNYTTPVALAAAALF